MCGFAQRLCPKNTQIRYRLGLGISFSALLYVCVCIVYVSVRKYILSEYECSLKSWNFFVQKIAILIYKLSKRADFQLHSLGVGFCR